MGASGRIVAVDIQPKMLTVLRRRLAKRGLLARVDARLAAPDSLGLADLSGAVDFALAEPRGHVKLPAFEAELKLAAEAGLRVTGRPSIPRSHSALLTRGLTKG